MRIHSSILLGTTLLGAWFVLGSGGLMAEPTCTARTPTQAIQMGRGKQIAVPMNTASSTSSSARYSLRRITMDPVLHRRWAFIENCSHPGRPLQVIALPAKTTSASLRNAADLPAGQAPATGKLSAASSPAAAQMAAIINRRFDAPASAQRAIPSSPAADPSNAILVRAGDRVHLWSSEANVRLEIEVVALEYGRAGQVIHMRRKGEEALLAGVVVGPDSAELMP